MTTTRKPKTRSQAERAKARKIADTTAERIAKLTPQARKKVVAEYDRIRKRLGKLGTTHDKELNAGAPTLEAAESDLLAVLQAVGAEFIRRYYPDATYASFYISKYIFGGSPAEYTASVPVPVPSRAPDRK